MGTRTDPQAIKLRLQQAGVWSKKYLGQHFLISSSALSAILETAAVTATDTVVEIGPGIGVLTEPLLHQAGRLVAFELDPDMVNILREDFPTLEIVPGDVLQTAPVVVPTLGAYKLVANIPYQITTPLLRLFLEGTVGRQPTSLTLLVQKEVGKRLAAKAGDSDRSYLSVLTEYFAEAREVAIVAANQFWPAPKVDSMVIHLQVRPSRAFSGAEEVAFLRLVRSLFMHPRKQLKNVIAATKRIPVERVAEVFQELGWAPTVRAQELTLSQWQHLFSYPW